MQKIIISSVSNNIIDCVHTTHRGNHKEINEDCLLIKSFSNCFFALVCDGVGGRKAGEFASQTACTGIGETAGIILDSEEELFKRDEINETIISSSYRNSINESYRNVHNELLKISEENEEYYGMATTAVSVFLKNNKFLCCNIGDSRLYKFSEYSLELITIDHSPVYELYLAGELTKKELRTHPRRNLINRALGVPTEDFTDFFAGEYSTGDIFLLCSDGLNSMVDDDSIKNILETEISNSEKLKLLMKLSLNNGGRDNITIIIIEIKS